MLPAATAAAHVYIHTSIIRCLSVVGTWRFAGCRSQEDQVFPWARSTDHHRSRVHS